MSELAPIIQLARKERKSRPLVHNLEQRLAAGGVRLLDFYSDAELDEWRDLGIIGGAPSRQDENGYTPAVKKWGAAYRLFREYAKTMSDDAARQRVADELKIKNKEAFYKVTKHGREDVNRYLRFLGLIP